MAAIVEPRFLVPHLFNILVYPNSEGHLVVTDINGVILLKVEPRNTTIHYQRVVVDLLDRAIVMLREKHVTAHGRWNAFRGNSDSDSDKMFTVTRSYVMQKKTDVSVFMENNSTKDCDFKIKGSWSQKRCTIHVGDSSTTIAEMRPWDTTSFMVTIQPNADYAFVVALIATVDAMKCRKNKTAANAKKTGEAIGGALVKLGIGLGIVLGNN